jgi:hypothetical protein
MDCFLEPQFAEQVEQLCVHSAGASFACISFSFAIFHILLLVCFYDTAHRFRTSDSLPINLFFNLISVFINLKIIIIKNDPEKGPFREGAPP